MQLLHGAVIGVRLHVVAAIPACCDGGDHPRGRHSLTAADVEALGAVVAATRAETIAPPDGWAALAARLSLLAVSVGRRGGRVKRAVYVGRMGGGRARSWRNTACRDWEVMESAAVGRVMLGGGG